MNKQQATNEINFETAFHRVITGAISNRLRNAWKGNLLAQLRRRPVHIGELSLTIAVSDHVDGLDIETRTLLDPLQMLSLVFSLQEEGFLVVDGFTITGAGPYEQVELTREEKKVLSKLTLARNRTTTVTGIRRKLKNSGLTTKHVHAVLDALVEKGYAEKLEETEAGSTFYKAL